MRISRPLSLIGGFLLLLIPETGFLAIIGIHDSVGDNPCLVTMANIPCGGGVSGVATFSSYVGGTLFAGAQLVFLAASIVMFALYGVRLMLESSEESTVTEVKSAYTYGIAGAAIVSLATLIVQTVGQFGSNNTALVNVAGVSSTLGTVIHFIRILVGTAVSAVVVYQGFRLIILQGEESELEQQKKRFFHTLIGVAVITLASTVVADFAPGAGSSDLADQMVGIANFLMVIIGGLAVMAFIVAGFLLVISTDEALKDRAKKAIFTAVIGLIVVLCTYVIINFVISLPAGVAGAGFNLF